MGMNDHQEQFINLGVLALLPPCRLSQIKEGMLAVRIDNKQTPPVESLDWASPLLRIQIERHAKRYD
jgi:hypothetical protein